MTPSLPAAVDQGTHPATTAGTRAPAPPAAAPPAAGPARALTGAGLAVLLLGFLPVNFTFGAVNLLVPAITADLDTGPSGGQLVLSAYTTTFAAGLVVSGRLGDRYGRRRLFTVGLVSFGVLAALTALAQGLVDLVVLRAALGLAAGLFTPQVLSTIQATAPDGLRARGIIMFTAASAVATIAGQVVAGAVVVALPEGLGWRAVQLVTAAIALAALLGLRAVPESRSDAPLALDLPGAALLGGGLMALVVPLTIGPTAGWPAWSLGLLAASAGMFAVFVVTQLRAEHRGLLPVVPPSVLRVPVVRIGLVMTMLFFVTYGAFLYEISEYSQTVWGTDGWGTAVLLLGFGGAFVVTALVLPRILRRVGPRIMVYAATVQAVVLLGIALVIGVDGGQNAPLALQPLLVALGAVQAMMFGPALQTVLSRTPTWAAGVAGGLLTTLQQLGLGLGVALLGGLFHAVADAASGPTGGTAAADATGSGSGLAVGLVAALVAQAACAVVFALLAHRVARHSAAR
ncbi:MFS transporter [Promicromonospora sp. NPDC050249]|uniref:MFS transporter n=1 Tax=Promicromonospora sp. NPDC050249 TaxID=3154743 RepID=UPI0033F5DBF1